MNMDYESRHGPGISNFSPSSSSLHRMPTISAAQALEDLSPAPTRCIPTGLPLLDRAIQNSAPTLVLKPDPKPEPFFGGICRGKITEIYGPPGVGKTALGIQLAVHALGAGEGVVWVDASHPIPSIRLTRMLGAFCETRHSLECSSQSYPRSPSDYLENFVHFSTPTLAHLLALFSQPTTDHPRPNTSLIVIDSLSTLISSAFPRTVDAAPAPKTPRAPKSFSRKFPILQHLLGTLQKLAATRNIAIAICLQCATKMRPGIGAVLVPAVSSTFWEQNLGCRIIIFRDWGWVDKEGDPVNDVRLAEVIKAEGVTLLNGKRWLVGFSVTENGLVPLPLPAFSSSGSHYRPLAAAIDPPSATNLPHKRKFSTTDLEIPDSEGEDDEDYGWAEEDEEGIPAMPPQWQGSEDILIPAPEEQQPEDEDGETYSEHEAEDGGKVAVDLREIDDSEDELAL